MLLPEGTTRPQAERRHFGRRIGLGILIRRCPRCYNRKEAEADDMNADRGRRLIWHGVVLFLVGLLTDLPSLRSQIPGLRCPRTWKRS